METTENEKPEDVYPFLDCVSTDMKAVVSEIIASETIEDTDKDSALKEIMDPILYQNYQNWKTSKQADKFLNLLCSGIREMAIRKMEENKLEQLGLLVKSNPLAVEPFELWKQLMREKADTTETQGNTKDIENQTVPPECEPESEIERQFALLSEPNDSEDDKDRVQKDVDEDDDENEEQELPEEYRIDWYYPVSIGEVFENRYHVIRNLGWGETATVWLCWDTTNKKFVALKIRQASMGRDPDIIKLMFTARSTDPSFPGYQCVDHILDQFDFIGCRGKHNCFVFEVIGCNSLELIWKRESGGLHIEHVRSIIRQVLEGLQYLHETCSIIHTDIKPENIIVTISPDHIKTLAKKAIKALKQNARMSKSSVISASLDITNVRNCSDKFEQIRLLESEMEDALKTSDVSTVIDWNSILNDPNAEIQVKITDFFNALWTYQGSRGWIGALEYRSLETILGDTFGTPMDIWSTACLAFELATGDYLFEPKESAGYSVDDDHLAHIIELLGPIPPNVYKRRYEWWETFNKHGGLHNISQLKPCCLVDVLRKKYEWSSNDAEQFSSFLLPMLDFDKNHRATAAGCLEHDFLKPFGGRQPSL